MGSVSRKVAPLVSVFRSFNRPAMGAHDLCTDGKPKAGTTWFKRPFKGFVQMLQRAGWQTRAIIGDIDKHRRIGRGEGNLNFTRPRFIGAVLIICSDGINAIADDIHNCPIHLCTINFQHYV